EGLGIFDQTKKKDNPFHDWGFVFIPYCTGDLFWGANDHDYPIGFNPATGPIYATIQHRGFVNFQAVLAYLEDNTNYPGKIFVTGSSAGSYGATMAFPYIKQAFPWSNVYLLGDAGNGIVGGTFPTEGIPKWNVQMPDWIFPGGYDPTMIMADIYIGIAAEYPWSRFAQYTTAFDGTQTFFYNVMLNINDPSQWNNIPPDVFVAWHLTMKNYAYTTALASPNYRYYIAAGTEHTIMGKPKFYTEESAGGMSFADWVKAMIKTPHKWENLECEECLP
ncbi:MAG: pectin acetylesterase-family hydrolase, partial [Thermodesulfobacteriota bacterium]|nr:pectin acetylesterase-family hydrolase [Thermodesulfobacteriota bacterium]